MMGIVVLTTWVVALAMNAERAQHICIGQVLGGGGGVDGGGLSPELCCMPLQTRHDLCTHAHNARRREVRCPCGVALIRSEAAPGPLAWPLHSKQTRPRDGVGYGEYLCPPDGPIPPTPSCPVSSSPYCE